MRAVLVWGHITFPSVMPFYAQRIKVEFCGRKTCGMGVGPHAMNRRSQICNFIKDKVPNCVCEWKGHARITIQFVVFKRITLPCQAKKMLVLLFRCSRRGKANVKMDAKWCIWLCLTFVFCWCLCFCDYKRKWIITQTIRASFDVFRLVYG